MTSFKNIKINTLKYNINYYWFYIKLKKYKEALLDLDRLFELNHNDISFTYLLKEHSDFWSFLCEIYDINNGHDFTKLGIVSKFNIYMYEGRRTLK